MGRISPPHTPPFCLGLGLKIGSNLVVKGSHERQCLATQTLSIKKAPQMWCFFVVWRCLGKFQKVRYPARVKVLENENLFMMSEDFWFESHSGFFIATHGVFG